MARGQPHSDELKAAVLAALLAGQSLNAVAKQYNVGRATVQAWRQAAGLDHGSAPAQLQKGAGIGDLVADYLRETLITLAVQQRHFRDPAWLAKQGASELAVLHGVSTDKAIRLLEALQPVSGDAEGSEILEGVTA